MVKRACNDEARSARRPEVHHTDGGWVHRRVTCDAAGKADRVRIGWRNLPGKLVGTLICAGEVIARVKVMVKLQDEEEMNLQERGEPCGGKMQLAAPGLGSITQDYLPKATSSITSTIMHDPSIQYKPNTDVGESKDPGDPS